MLTCDTALRDGRPLGGLVLLSGTLLAEEQWLPLMAARAGLPVFQSHGRHDPLLPFAVALRLRDELTAAGLDVTFVEHGGGHEIPEPVLLGLADFLARVARDRRPDGPGAPRR
jgi:phospholipase/carboxylesterase